MLSANRLWETSYCSGTLTTYIFNEGNESQRSKHRPSRHIAVNWGCSRVACGEAENLRSIRQTTYFNQLQVELWNKRLDRTLKSRLLSAKFCLIVWSLNLDAGEHEQKLDYCLMSELNHALTWRQFQLSENDDEQTSEVAKEVLSQRERVDAYSQVGLRSITLMIDAKLESRQ
jgi:hypothetical protein